MSEAAAAPGFARLFSDERLTQRAVGGDERAFAAIFRRYHQGLYRFCLAIVGNPDDAQEALQNTMTKVLRALPGEKREIELKPWLYRIAHNESIDLLRRRRETSRLGVEQIAPGYGLAEDVATRERLRMLIADLGELPERQRQALVMRELGGLDFEEIATALATSGAVARQTLYEARQNLRQMDEGREMSCAAVRKALSDGDGRVARRRAMRSHLRACTDCRAFGEEIRRRQSDFAALSPLPAVAAAGMLQGLVGGSHGAAGGGGLTATLGSGAAKTIGASAVAKGVATVAVVAAIGVTAADQSGAIHLGLPGERRAKRAAATTTGEGAQAGGGVRTGGGKDAAAGGGSHPVIAGAMAGSAVVPNRAPAGPAPDLAAAVAGRSSEPSGHQTHDQAQGRGVEAGGDAQGWGPGVEHPAGHGHETAHPAAASKGQETAAANAPSTPGKSKGVERSGGKAAGPGNPPHPAQPAKETPTSPKQPSSTPAATPEAGVVPSNPPDEESGPPAGRGSERAAEKRSENAR